ncbi:MAG: hypothetical protein RIC14_09045 [Filomicrobium sp.]
MHNAYFVEHRMQRAKNRSKTRRWQVAILAAVLIACTPQLPKTYYTSDIYDSASLTTTLSGSISMLIPLPDRFSFAVMASHWRNRPLPLHGPVIIQTKKEAEKIWETRNQKLAGVSTIGIRVATTSPHYAKAVKRKATAIANSAPAKSITARNVVPKKKVRRWKVPKKIKPTTPIKVASNWADEALYFDTAQ